MTLYLLLTILFIAIQGLFAFFEMACVSFNKVRLQYYVSVGSRRAIWLEYLLKRPSRLFGTTLIGITTSLMIGSECARHFYETIGLDPDWAPITQVPLVVIFGELAPMFAARRHSEQVAMLCIPLMIVIAKLLTPITLGFDLLSNLIHRIMGKKAEAPLFLSRDEVKMAFEDQDEGKDEFDTAASQIFLLKNFTAGELMIPLSEVRMVPSSATLSEVRHLLSVHYAPIIPIYHKFQHNIVSVIGVRELLSLNETKRVIESAHSPWFITKETPILFLLSQFCRNNQNLAVVLDSSGQAIGILTIDEILEKVFGEEPEKALLQKVIPHYIERTLSGEMSISEFNKQFEEDLPAGEGDTLSDLLVKELGHLPVKDETIRIEDLIFTIDEPSLLGIKKLSVRSIK